MSSLNIKTLDYILLFLHFYRGNNINKTTRVRSELWLFNQMICLCYAIRLSDTRWRRWYLLNLQPQLWNTLCRLHTYVTHTLRTLLLSRSFACATTEMHQSDVWMIYLQPWRRLTRHAACVTWLKAKTYSNSMQSWNVQHLHIKDDVIWGMWKC